jgi:hypothetical protein
MSPVAMNQDFISLGCFHGLPPLGKKFDIDNTAGVNIMVSVMYLQ